MHGAIYNNYYSPILRSDVEPRVVDVVNPGVVVTVVVVAVVVTVAVVGGGGLFAKILNRCDDSLFLESIANVASI